MKFVDTKYYKVGRTLIKTFLSTVLGQLIVFGSGIFNLSASEWKTVAAAGAAAVILTAYNSLNPNYTDYGIGSLPKDEVVE